MLTSDQIYHGKNLKIYTLPVGQLQANCYLVVDKKSLKCLIIDPGDDADYIENIIRDKNLMPIKIICTHGHFDHIGAILELKLAYKIPFMINKEDEFLLKRAGSSAKYFVGIDIGPKVSVDEYLEKNKVLGLSSSKFKIISTPGHTQGSVCLYEKNEGILFCGDLIFAGGAVGRTDFSYGSNDDLQKSLRKIFKLPKDTLVFPGHGESFML